MVKIVLVLVPRPRPRESEVRGVIVEIFSRTRDEYEDEDDMSKTELLNSKGAAH